jgi:hypothetical protein
LIPHAVRRCTLPPSLHPKPEHDEWGAPLDAVKSALELEKSVNQALLELHALAGTKGDGQMCAFLDDFLHEQVTVDRNQIEMGFNLDGVSDLYQALPNSMVIPGTAFRPGQ